MYALSRLRTAAAALVIAVVLTGTVSGVASAAADALIVQAQSANARSVDRLSGGARDVRGGTPLTSPDLRVEYVSVSERGGAKTYVYWVQNVGAATARDVKVEKACAYQEGPYAGDVHTSSGWQQLGDVPAGAALEVQVPCNAPRHAFVVASSLEAHTTSGETGAVSTGASAGVSDH